MPQPGLKSIPGVCVGMASGSFLFTTLSYVDRWFKVLQIVFQKGHQFDLTVCDVFVFSCLVCLPVGEIKENNASGYLSLQSKKRTQLV